MTEERSWGTALSLLVWFRQSLISVCRCPRVLEDKSVIYLFTCILNSENVDRNVQFSIHGCRVWRPVGWIYCSIKDCQLLYSIIHFFKNYSSGYVFTQISTIFFLFFPSEAIIWMHQPQCVFLCCSSWSFSTVPIKALCQGCKTLMSVCGNKLPAYHITSTVTHVAVK